VDKSYRSALSRFLVTAVITGRYASILSRGVWQGSVVHASSSNSLSQRLRAKLGFTRARVYQIGRVGSNASVAIVRGGTPGGAISVPAVPVTTELLPRQAKKQKASLAVDALSAVRGAAARCALVERIRGQPNLV
jgi:hypothetical protein